MEGEKRGRAARCWWLKDRGSEQKERESLQRMGEAKLEKVQGKEVKPAEERMVEVVRLRDARQASQELDAVRSERGSPGWRIKNRPLDCLLAHRR